MKIVFGIILLLSSIVSSSQEDREAIFKSMDDSIKVNPAINKAKPKKPEGLNGKVKFIIEDYYLPDREKPGQIGLKVLGNCYKYWYSQDGQLIRRQNYFDTVIYSDEVFLYNKGLLYQVNIKGRSGKPHNFYYTYDSKGYLIKEQHIFDGKTTNKKIFNYDNKGRLKQQLQFGDGYSSIAKGDYYYSGNQLDSITGEKGRTIFIYYPNGLLKQETSSSPGTTFPTLYKYDRYSNLIEKSHPTIKYVETFSYEYDKQSNWVTKYNYHGGSMSAILKRTIEYY